MEFDDSKMMSEAIRKLRYGKRGQSCPFRNSNSRINDFHRRPPPCESVFRGSAAAVPISANYFITMKGEGEKEGGS